MLRIALKPSACLAGLLIGAHLAAAAAVLPLDLPHGVKLALLILLVTSLAHGLWCHVLLKARTACIGIEVGKKGAHAALRTRDGVWHEAQVLATTYVSPRLSVLNFRLNDGNAVRHVLILPDSGHTEEIRRLRVFLRWGYRSEG